MPVLLRDRATLTSPLPLVTSAEGRMLELDLYSDAYHRVRRGVHVDRLGWNALPGWRKYQVRVFAYLRLHPDAVMCLESAAVIHGLPLSDHSRFIHVYELGRASSRTVGDVFIHASTRERAVVRVGGIHVTSMLDTVVDLARVLPPANALAVTDAAISPAQGGRLDVERLREHGDAGPAARGSARMRWVWDHADSRSESPGETFSRAVILWSGFEHPVLQQTFLYEGCRDRVDFFFPSMRGVGESDGWGKYDMNDPIAAERHLRDEKRREDRLRRHGHPVARWDTADTFRVTALCRALQQAGVPVIRPAQPAMLASLSDSSRVAVSAGRSETVSGPR